MWRRMKIMRSRCRVWKKDSLVNLSLAITRDLTPEKDHDMAGLIIPLITSQTTNEGHKFNVTKD